MSCVRAAFRDVHGNLNCNLCNGNILGVRGKSLETIFQGDSMVLRRPYKAAGADGGVAQMKYRMAFPTCTTVIL